MEDIGTQRRDVAYKAAVAIVLGLIGFCIGRCPILIGDGQFHANLTIGFIFPMLITLAWGWHYGLLSATIGLGCQAPWFLWLHIGGYAPLVIVPLFTVWIVWHGWCRERYHSTGNALWHSLVVEIPFRIAEALILYFIYPWVLQFNPAPWSSLDAPPVISLASIHLIVGRQFINAYIVLSVCEVLLNLGVIRRMLRLKLRAQEGETSRIVGVALLFGFAYWLLDTLLGLYVFQVGQGNFIDNLILQVGPEETAERMAVLLACCLGGVVAARAMQRKRQMADALEHAQRQFHGVFMATDDAILMLHEDGRIFEANPAACRLLGYTSEELTSLNTEAIVPPEWIASYKCTMQTLLNSGAVFKESEYLCKNGTIIPVEVTANRFALGDEAVILSITRDTTARKQAEERLARSERIYRETIESAMGVPYQLNPATGDYDFIGSGVESLLGIRAEQMNHEWLREHTKEGVVTGTNADTNFDEYCRRFLETRLSIFRADYRIMTDGGVEKWICDTATAIYNEQNGRVVRILGILQDITERKEIEAALRESKRRLSTLMGNLPGMAYRCRNDSHWTMLFVSEGCEQLCGYTPADLLENHTVSWNDIVLEDDRSAVWNAIQTMVAQQAHFDVTYRIVHASGEIKHVSERGTGVFSPQGELVALEGFIEDVTTRRKAEYERERLIEKLEAQNAELEGFTYTVSHDLKSPLITIRGFAEMIVREIAQGEYARVTDDLLRISKAADRMHELLDELLRLSRIGRIANPPVPVRLYDLTQEVVAMLSGLIVDKGITVEISRDLPTIYGDEPRLFEVLQNLIENAAKFVGDQPLPKISIGVRQDGDEEVYWVQDNGSGIEQQYHEKVFQIFDKLDPASEGTGIGLALVKRIVEVHGGRIWVESDGNSTGSTFCFTLPHVKKEGPDE